MSRKGPSIMLVFNLILVSFLAMLITLPIVGGSSEMLDTPLNGTPITNCTELQNMINDLDGDYYLANDIDCTNTSLWNNGSGFQPVGNLTNKFNGTFSGQDFKIINLTINRSKEDYVGLFGYTNTSALIINVTMENVNITGNGTVGALVGNNEAMAIENCSIQGKITGNFENVGGLVGNNHGLIRNCTSNCDVNSVDDYTGGFIGRNSGKVINCSSSGNVTGVNYVGGFVGDNSDLIYNCSINVNIIGNNYVGGLIGQHNSGLIVQSSSNGSVIGNQNVGGLLGYLSGGTYIVNSTSSTTLNASGNYVGGLIGYNDGSEVMNCTSFGNTNGSVQYVGGLIGFNIGKITSCKTMGYTIGNSIVGGLLGRNDGGSIFDCFALGYIIGNSNIGGLIGYNSDGAVTNCTAFGDVTGSGGSTVGGLVGYLTNGAISACNAFGDVTGSNEVGGLIGYNNGETILYCTAHGNSTGSGNKIGGLIGRNTDYGDVFHCQAFGVTTGNFDVGGLIGNNENSMIINCTAIGETMGTQRVGGLIGYILREDRDPTIANCKAYGNASGSINIGGLIGRTENGAPVFNCVAYGNTTGIGDNVGGLIGDHDGNVTNCYAYGYTRGNNNVGGLVGNNIDGIMSNGNMTDCDVFGDVNATGNNVGGLIGSNQGIITNSTVISNVNGNQQVGGLIGINTNIIFNCNITSSIKGVNNVGGLVGDNQGNKSGIGMCNSYGTVNGSGNAIGGLVGENNGIIMECNSYSETSGNNSVGGVIGSNDGPDAYVDECEAFGNVTGLNANVGGLIGSNNYGAISYCTAHGITTGNDTVGGLIGKTDNGSAVYCYSYRDVSGTNRVGGLIGWCDDNNGSAIIVNSYSNSDVTGVSIVGGFVGQNNNALIVYCYSSGNVTGNVNAGGFIGSGSGSINSCFWDNITSSQSLSAGGSGRNTTEMMKELTFTSAGWDFTNIWGIGEGMTYPFFQIWYNPPQILTSDVGTATEDILYSVDYDGYTSAYPHYNMIESWTVETNTSTWLSIDNNGILSGTPPNGVMGSFWVNISMRDLCNRTDSHNFSLSVANVNDEPIIITSELVNATEDLAYNLTMNGTDIDPTLDTLTWSVSTDATWLNINSSSGNLTGIPLNADVGVYWVNITLDDGKGGIVNRNFTLEVLNVNDPPEIINTQIPNSTTEDVLYYVQINASDIDPTNDILTWTFNSNAFWLVFNDTSGNLSGTPDNSDVGTYWVNLTVSDGNNGTDQVNYTITVINLNDNPELIIPTIVDAIEDQNYQVVFSASDPDPTADILTWNLTTDATWLSMNETTNVVFGTPLNEHVGMYWINVSVSDGIGGLVWHNFTVLVHNVNDPPNIITDDLESANEDELYAVDYFATDIDPTNDVLTWALKTDADWLTINTTTGILSGTPTNEDIGVYWVNITVTDGKLEFDWRNFSIEVYNVNDDPVILTNDVSTAKAAVLYSVDYNVTDDDYTDDTFTWSLLTNASWLKIDTESGILSGTPLESDVGSYWINVTVGDGNGGFDSHNFTLIVESSVIIINQAPKITTGNLLTTKVGEKYSVDYDATDDRTPAANLKWTVVSNASWLDIEYSTGVLSGTPTENDVGSYWINVTVLDGEGGSAFVNFTLLVTKPKLENKKPKLTDGTMAPESGDTETEFTFTVDYIDEDGDNASYVKVVIDGEEHDMVLVSGDGSNGTWEVKLKLPKGTHEYFFTASDGTDEAEPGDSTPSGPADTKETSQIEEVDEVKDEEEGKEADFIPFLLLIIILLVIVVIIAFALSRRKRSEEDEEGEEEEEEEEQKLECPECGGVVGVDETACSECGAEFGEDEEMEMDEAESEPEPEEPLMDDEPVEEELMEEEPEAIAEGETVTDEGPVAEEEPVTKEGLVTEEETGTEKETVENTEEPDKEEVDEE